VTSPLREVLTLAKRCSGGVILGFSQFQTVSGTWKKGTPAEERSKRHVSFPTPWNHIEGGILFALKLPVIVFRERDVSGGLFDPGVTDLFIQEMPIGRLTTPKRRALREILQKWSALVR